MARHRRVLAAACLGLAVALLVPVFAPPAPPTVEVLVAARDLPAGHLLGPQDLTAAAWPVGARPDGALGAAGAGRVTAAPMRRGEPLTDARVVGPGLLEGAPAGTLAVAVRPADPAAILLLRQGDRAAVLAGGAPGDPGPSGQGQAEVLVASARVLAVPTAGSAGGPSTDGGGLLDVPGAPTEGMAGVVVLAVPQAEAARIAAAAGTRTITVALRGP